MTVTTNLPVTSTCSPWATVDDLCEPCTGTTLSAINTANPTLIADALQAASDVLFQLSGRQYPGICEETVRPCARTRRVDHGRPVGGYSGMGAGYITPPAVVGGGWIPSWGFCLCNREERTGCSSVPEIALGAFPVTAIVEVFIGGQVVDPTTYRIDDDRYLVRIQQHATDQVQGWPCCQRMDLPATEPGTWQVTYTYGVPPPVAGKLAAAELGCQLALAATPSAQGACRLPQRVTNIVRQGVSAVVLDPMKFIDQGKTGLYLCDVFLAAVNPQGLRRRATVMSPDLGRRVRRTGL